MLKKRIISLALLSMLSLASLYGCSEDNKSVEVVVEESVPVSVEKLVLRDISEKTTFSGTIIPNEEHFIVPKMPGKVKSVSVEVGSQIKSGSTVFTMDNRDIQNQVNQAKKSLDLAQSNYNNAKEQANNAPPGLAGAGPSLGTIEIQVEQAKLAYSQAIEALEDAIISSPATGVVSQVNINTGGMASNAQAAVVVLDTSKMYVEIDVPENIITSISLGQSVDFDISSINKKGEGTIETLSPSPDEMTKLYKVRVLIKDLEEDIKPGMFVKANLVINFKKDVLAVRTDSIIEDGTSNYVYIVEKDEAEKDRASKKQVKLGIDSGEYTEILEGLKKDQEVLVKGQDYVEDGTKVKIIRGEK